MSLDVLGFLADDKCPKCGSEGVFQWQDELKMTITYYCRRCDGYFNIDVMKDPYVKNYLSSKQKVTNDE